MLVTLGNQLKLRRKLQLFDRTPTRILQGVVKELAPGILMLIFSFGGAGLLYLIETKSHHVELNELYGQNKNSCLSSVGYWGSLYYVNTLYTTIGYGNVYCCTVWGRFFTVIYTVIGIPLVVIVLDATGKIFFINVGRLWFKLKSIMNRLCQRKSSKSSVIAAVVQNKSDWCTFPPNPASDLDQAVHESHPATLPVSVGVSFTLLWILLCAAFFTITEGWSYLDAVYFTFISLTTVGLGDFAPRDYRLAVATFAAVMIGLALVSMSIKIIQNNIEQLFEDMQNKILLEYKKRQLEGEDSVKSDGNETKKSGLLEALMSEKQLKQLQGLSDEKGRMRVKGAQAVVEMVDVEAGDTLITRDQTIQNVPLQVDKECQVKPMQRSVPVTAADLSNLTTKKSMKHAWTSTQPMWK